MLGYRRETAWTAGSAHSEMLRTENGRRKGTENEQRDKPLDGSRGEAPSLYNWQFSLRQDVRLSAGW